MQIGLMLPSFASGAGPALDAARVADERGLDGVFVFDHLWPMGNPGRPALWSFGVLAAAAAITTRVRLGPLVARVGLLPDDDVVAAVRTIGAIAGGDRVIAALGAGDRLSAAENLAFGVAFPPARARLEAVGGVCDRLRAAGVETWVGGRSPGAAAVAEEHADGLNLWAAPSAEVRRASMESVEKIGARGGRFLRISWGGQVLVGRDDDEVSALRTRHGDRPGLVSGTVAAVAATLRELGEAGASWCVCAPLDYVAQPVRAAETLALVAEAVR